jgi:7,8-dihydropterin-6-yl-methyl-4-(beta-D-ribofuranosyl)aminobenzene 5'-phosphate synthase
VTLDQVRATVLVENTAGRPDVTPEHGLSVWIEAGEWRVLFDTGQSGVVCANAERVGVDLSEADAIVLSHGHYDHTGGLAAVQEVAPEAAVFVHPAAEMDTDTGHWLISRAPEVVVPGVHTTGEVRRETDYETGRGYPLSFPDDQGLFFEVPDGVVVLVGCAHAGVVNTLQQVARLTRAERLHAVFGGMHLGGVTRERLERTAGAFREWGLERIGPCHCTGEEAIGFFEEKFPDEFVRCQTGSVLEFGGSHG